MVDDGQIPRKEQSLEEIVLSCKAWPGSQYMPRHDPGNTSPWARGTGTPLALLLGTALSFLLHAGSYSRRLTYVVRENKARKSSVDTVPVTLVFQHNRALLFLDKKITDFVFTFEVRMRHLSQR